jgi:hypothetical protein
MRGGGVQIVRGHQQGNTLTIQFSQQHQDHLSRLNIQPDRWFIQYQQIRFGYQGPRKKDALLLTTR